MSNKEPHDCCQSTTSGRLLGQDIEGLGQDIEGVVAVVAYMAPPIETAPYVPVTPVEYGTETNYVSVAQQYTSSPLSRQLVANIQKLLNAAQESEGDAYASVLDVIGSLAALLHDELESQKPLWEDTKMTLTTNVRPDDDLTTFSASKFAGEEHCYRCSCSDEETDDSAE